MIQRLGHFAFKIFILHFIKCSNFLRLSCRYVCAATKGPLVLKWQNKTCLCSSRECKVKYHYFQSTNQKILTNFKLQWLAFPIGNAVFSMPSVSVDAMWIKQKIIESSNFVMYRMLICSADVITNWLIIRLLWKLMNWISISAENWIIQLE